MADIIEFKKNEEQEDCQCESCNLVESFIEQVLETDSYDELFEVLGEMVNIAKIIGYKDAFEEDIKAKSAVLDELCGIAEDDE